jgi:hypoxanthine phosphoribosyltransferase
MPSPARKKRPGVPARWRAEIQSVLISAEELSRRIAQLSRQIHRDYRDKDLVVVSILNGTVLFLPDLIRNIPLPLQLDFIGVSSYGTGTRSGGLTLTREPRLDVRGREVLIVDDILDTGRTLRTVINKLSVLKPCRIKTCVLLDKPARRIEKIEADYAGFEIPDYFVVGYGLDYAEKYRNLPFIGVLRQNQPEGK